MTMDEEIPRGPPALGMREYRCPCGAIVTAPDWVMPIKFSCSKCRSPGTMMTKIHYSGLYRGGITWVDAPWSERKDLTLCEQFYWMGQR